MTKLHHLQALRALAATMVIIDHCCGALISRNVLDSALTPFFWHFGEIGVAIFFVISGFIMYTMSKDDFGCKWKPYEFMLKRVIRIVPIYWIATLLSFVLAMYIKTKHSYSIEDLVNSLLFIPFATDINTPPRPVLGQGWTLNYEMFFYLIFFASLFLSKRLALPILTVVFVGLVICGMVLDGGNIYVSFYSNSIILLFYVGVLVGVYHQRLSKWFNFRSPMLLVLFLIMIDVTIYYVSMHYGLVKELSILFAALSICCVIICVSATNGNIGRYERVVEALGDASYSTYLFHGFILSVFVRILHFNSILNMVIFLVGSIVLSNIFGLVVNKVVEVPITQTLRSVLLKPKKTSMQAA